MAFCTNCGRRLEGNEKYCPSCGHLTKQTDTDGFNMKTEDPAADFAKYDDSDCVFAEKKDAADNKLMAVLAYLGILVLIPIFCAPKSAFARYHANQGLILWICSAVYFTATDVLSTVVGLFSPTTVYMTLTVAFALLSLVFVVFAIAGIVNACNGEKKELPLIGKYKILK